MLTLTKLLTKLHFLLELIFVAIQAKASPKLNVLLIFQQPKVG